MQQLLLHCCDWTVVIPSLDVLTKLQRLAQDAKFKLVATEPVAATTAWHLSVPHPMSRYAMTLLLEFLDSHRLPDRSATRCWALLFALTPWRVYITPTIPSEELKLMSWALRRLFLLDMRLSACCNPLTTMALPLVKWLLIHHLVPWNAALFLLYERGLLTVEQKKGSESLMEMFMVDHQSGPTLPHHSGAQILTTTSFQVPNPREMPPINLLTGVIQDTQVSRDMMPWRTTCLAPDLSRFLWLSYLSGSYYPSADELATFLQETEGFHRWKSGHPQLSSKIGSESSSEVKPRTEVKVEAKHTPRVSGKITFPFGPVPADFLFLRLTELKEVFHELQRWFQEWDQIMSDSRRPFILDSPKTEVWQRALEHAVGDNVKTRQMSGITHPWLKVVYCSGPVPIFPNGLSMRVMDRNVYQEHRQRQQQQQQQPLAPATLKDRVKGAAVAMKEAVKEAWSGKKPPAAAPAVLVPVPELKEELGESSDEEDEKGFIPVVPDGPEEDAGDPEETDQDREEREKDEKREALERLQEQSRMEAEQQGFLSGTFPSFQCSLGTGRPSFEVLTVLAGPLF